MIALLRSLRQDRLLTITTVVMACICLYPLTTTPILPFIDLPHHVALSRLLWDVAFKLHGADVHYELDITPVPYWTAYVLLALAGRLFGAYAGTKLVVALAALSIPLGTMRLLGALGRSPRLGLLAFLLVWDFNMCFGWLNHVLAVGLSLFVMAQTIEAETPRDAMKAWPLGVVLALTHILPFAFLGVTVGLTALLRRRGIRLHAVAVAVPSLALVPWLWHSLGGTRTDPGFAFDPIDVRLENLFTYTLGNGPVDSSGPNAAGVAFVALLLGPLLLALLPQRDHRPGGHSRLLAAAPLLAALLLYFTLPLSVARPVEHWGTYPRFASLILLGALLIPSPRLDGRAALTLVPFTLVGTWMSLTVASQFRAFTAEIDGFYDAARRIPKGASLLPLCYENTFRSVRPALGESLHGYITAQTGGYNPYLFGQPTNPIHYRKDGVIPAPAGWGRRPAMFSMKAYGKRYDFILVLGRGTDPLPREKSSAGKAAVLVFERDRFRLYAVR